MSALDWGEDGVAGECPVILLGSALHAFAVVGTVGTVGTREQSWTGAPDEQWLSGKPETRTGTVPTVGTVGTVW